MPPVVFSRPEILPWLWSLLPLALFLGGALAWRWRLRRRGVSPALRDRVVVGASPALEVLATILVFLAFVGGILALARPCWGEHLVPAPSRGADVVLVLDASLSMRANDVPPDRLELARRDLHRLIDALGPCRLGLVVFAGSGVRMVPLTTDRAAVATLLEAASPDAVPRPGTDLSAALESAGRVLEPSKATHRVVVLVTDGGDHSGKAANASRSLTSSGASLWIAGVGGTSPIPIPLPEGGFKQDREGNTVTVALERQTLQDIASSSNAKYLELGATSWELAPVVEEVARSAGLDGPEGTRKAPIERHPWFTGFALLTLSLSLLVPHGRTKRSPT
ncbi:MAG: VWA domain-containing protein [Fibrobacteria bacterium]|nr:VWA domain-containing protein [Fibrobacteria bacterium]